MYKCNHCGKIFETPKTVVETHGLDCGPYETWSGCPECNDYDFSEAIYHDGDYYTADELKEIEEKGE